MKRGVLTLVFITIMLTGFVSAQFGYGLSLSDFLYSINSSTLILFLLFLIFFVILNNVIFINFFRGNKMVSTVLSLSISIMAVWGLNRMNWDLGSFFFTLGLSEDTLYTLVLIVLLIAVIYAIFKGKLRLLFLGLGLLLIILAFFTDIFFEWTTALLIGTVLVVIWAFLAWRARRKKKEEPHYGGKGYEVGSPPPQSARSAPPPQSSPEETSRYDSSKERNRINIARKVGIQNLIKQRKKIEGEYKKGVKKAGELHSKATRLGWTKTKEGNAAYKEWYRYYSRVGEIPKQVKQIDNRINELKRKLR